MVRSDMRFVEGVGLSLVLAIPLLRNAKPMRQEYSEICLKANYGGD